MDRHGKHRVRFRKAGFTTYITGTPWSEDFMRQYAAALDGVKAQAAEPGRNAAWIIRRAVRCLLPVRRLREPQASTQAQRRNVIEKFRAEHGTKPIKGLDRVTSET